MTNTEKIRQEIERQMSLWWEKLPDAGKDTATWTQDEAKALGEYMAYENLLYFIDSLPNEQPEDVVVIAKTFLDALSKTPYNNKPITDAQVIVKQLLVFLKNPSSYNPNAINEQEQLKVDLEDVIENYILENFGERWDGCVPVGCFELDLMAKHFYKLGINARKEE